MKCNWSAKHVKKVFWTLSLHTMRDKWVDGYEKTLLLIAVKLTEARKFVACDKIWSSFKFELNTDYILWNTTKNQQSAKITSNWDDHKGQEKGIKDMHSLFTAQKSYITVLIAKHHNCFFQARK